MSFYCTEYDTRHGGPYDRGGADAYYGREFRPHYFAGATYKSDEVVYLTADELAAYTAGYQYYRADRKEW